MKKLSVLLLLLFSLFLFDGVAEAKVLPQAQKSGKTATAKSSDAGIGVSPVLRADRRALNVYFSNLQNAKSVSYFLIYKTSAQDEGAGGALNLNSTPGQTAELLFGTCSKGVCRYHTGIKDAKLEISYSLKSGKKYIKRFRIKV